MEEDGEGDGIFLLEIGSNCCAWLCLIGLKQDLATELRSHFPVVTGEDQMTPEKTELSGNADSDGEDVAAPLKRRRKILLIDDDDED